MMDFPEVKAFNYWDSVAVETGIWILGLLPSVHLAALAYMKKFKVCQLDCPGRLLWPYHCGGILGMDRSLAQAALAVGHPGYLSTNAECRELANLFAESRMTDPDETWYVQGKCQFLWVLQQRPDGTIRQLKVCGQSCEGGFDLDSVQVQNWDDSVVKVVEVSGPDGHQLPVTVECTDHWGARLTFFHCAWLPKKLISDFKITLQGRRGREGWIPPRCVSPKLYDSRGQFIPPSERLSGKRGQR